MVHLEKAIVLVASIVLFLLMTITLCDVVGRQIFASPIAGATELTECALVLITFLVYPMIAFRRRHITVDLLDSFFPPRALVLQRVASGLLGAVVFGCLAWRLWILGDRSLSYGDTTAYLAIPIGPVFWFMSITSGATALAFLLLIVRAPAADRARPLAGTE